MQKPLRPSDSRRADRAGKPVAGSRVEWLPDDPFQGHFDPPLDTAVSRFALVHPFLRSEMHDDTGTYLSTGV